MPSRSEKKRANGVAEDSRPKKRIAIAHDNKPISVNVVQEDAKSWPAAFTEAPGLELGSNISYKPYRKPVTSSEGRGSSNEFGDLLLHSSDHPRLEYVAEQPPPDSFESGYKHYVGVYDPASSTLEILPAKQLTVKSKLKRAFVVEQKLAAEEAEKAAAAQAGQSAGAKFAAARKALGEEFGTKRAKKAIQSAANNVVAAPDAGTVGESGASITSHTRAVIEGARMGEGEGDGDGDGDRDERQAALTELSNSAHPRPTPKIDAEKPADIYSLPRVIGRRELDMMSVDDWVAAGGEHQKVESQFVAKRMISIVSGADMLHIKALKFLNILITWKNHLVGGNTKKRVPKPQEMEEKMPDVNRNVLQMISKKFSPNFGKLNPWDVQRLLLHICAIALVLDRCTTDMYNLQEDLKITSSEIRNLYKELGCKVAVPTDKELAERGLTKEEAKQHYLAKLRLPFKLKEVRTRRIKR